MAINLVESFHETVGDLLIQKGSPLLGETIESSTAAVKAIVPALLAVIRKKGHTQADAASLLTYMVENNIDGSVLTNVAGKLEGNIETEKLLYSGAVILRYLQNDKISPLGEFISGYSGIKPTSSTAFLKLSSALLMGLVGQQIRENNLDAGGLQDLLAAQQSAIETSLPPRLVEAFELNPVSSTNDPSKANTTGAGTSVIRKSGFSKLLPWVVLGLVCLGIFYFLPEKSASDIPQPAVSLAITDDTVKADTQKVVNPFKDYKLQDGSTLSALPSSFTGQLASFLTGKETGDRCFAFDKVSFEEGSFKITERSEAQLNQLVKLLSAYPETKISLEGHTDEEGDSGKNKSLSKERAKVIKTWLTSHEIAPGRIDTKGWGGEKPIASNDTKWGRQQNRRIEVCLTRK